ncbi:neprilysin-21-like [Ornithodoros turicata]|uniref:neprilysin-21-like n=1 Tax=Ornithodoros turicata TaxID=34597 RepID=UPI00313A19E2
MPSNRRDRRASYPAGRHESSRSPRQGHRKRRKEIDDDAVSSTVDLVWDSTPRKHHYSPRTIKKLTRHKSTDDHSDSDHSSETGASEGTTTRPLRKRLAGAIRRLPFLRSDSSSSSSSPRTSADVPAQGDLDLETDYGSSRPSSPAKGSWYWKNQVPSGTSSTSTSGMFKRPTTPNSVFAVFSTAIVLLCAGSLLYLYVNWSNDRLAMSRHKMPSPENMSKKDIDGETLMPTNDPQQAPGILAPEHTTTHPKPSVTATKISERFNGTLRTLSDTTEPNSPLSTTGSIVKESLRGSCLSRFCLAHSAFLKGFIDWSVDPCGDFYGFVCPVEWPSQRAVSSDARLSDQVDRVLYRSFRDRMGVGTRGKVKEKAIALIEDCWRKTVPKSSRREFREILEDVGIGRWPFKNNKDHVDVWKVAATLIRDLQLDTLMSVDVEEYVTNVVGVVIVINEPDLLIGQYGTKDKRLPRWYYSAIVSCFQMFRDYDFNATVRGVKEFSEKLSEITSSRGQEDFSANRFRLATVGSYAVYKPLLSFVFRGILTVRDKTKLLVKSDRYLRALKSLLQMTKASDVLNYMGFRVLLHVSPFMTEEYREFYNIRMRQVSGQKYTRSWPRWKRCLRVLEHIFKDLYLFTYARYVDAKVEENKITSFATDVKGHVLTAFGNLPWMVSQDKAKSKNLLASLQIRFFYPKTITKFQENMRYATYMPPIPGRLLYTYREYTKRTVVDRFSSVINRKGPRINRMFWKGSVFATYPSFDVISHTIYVPMAILDLAELNNEDSFAVQVPRISTRIIMSLLQGVHPRSYSFGKVEWALNTSLSVQNIELCLTMQYRNITNEMVAEKLRASLTTEYNFLDNAAVKPAYEVFMKYLKDHNIGVTDTGGLRSLTTEHLFYILYAHGLCEEGNAEMTRQEFQEDTYSQPRLRVNIPLQNSKRFAKLWNCTLNSPMNPARKCPLWSSGS